MFQNFKYVVLKGYTEKSLIFYNLKWENMVEIPEPKVSHKSHTITSGNGLQNT